MARGGKRHMPYHLHISQFDYDIIIAGLDALLSNPDYDPKSIIRVRDKIEAQNKELVDD
jgi:hypothetical protein